MPVTGGITPQAFTLAATASALGGQPTMLTTSPYKQLVCFVGTNTSPNPRYVRFYDTAVAATSTGITDTPKVICILPGNSAGAGSNLWPPANLPSGGLQFIAGIGMQVTANAALNDLSGIGINEVTVTVGIAG